MHANLRTTLAAAMLVAAVPAAGIASAHEGKGRERGDKPGKRCERGKGYEAKGLLADGSALEQIAGADTARRSDDRFTGTVVVQIKQGNKRGRQDKGLTSYVVTNVRALGTVAGDDPLPPVGTRVQLVGRLAKPCAPAPTTPTSTPAPTPTPEPTATQLGRDVPPPTTPTDDAPAPDYPSDPGTPTGDAPKASSAVIDLVVFKPGRQRPEKVRGGDDASDDASADDRGGDRPRRKRPAGGDGACGPVAQPQSAGDDEDEASDRPCAMPNRADDQADDDATDDEPGDDER